jgi:hypothetical protein
MSNKEYPRSKVRNARIRKLNDRIYLIHGFISHREEERKPNEKWARI